MPLIRVDLKILRVLLKGPKTRKEIAEEIGIDLSSIRPVINSLHESGWVSNDYHSAKRSPSGRVREYKLELTDGGKIRAAALGDASFLDHSGEESEEILEKLDIAGLIKALQTGWVRAAESLGEIKAREAVEPLIQALKSKEPELRRAAAWALGEICDTRAIEPLVQALYDNYKVVGEHAALSLGKIRDPRAIGPLIIHLEPYTGISGCAMSSIEKIGKPAVEQLIKALKDENEAIRQIVAVLLGRIGDPRAIEPLKEATKDRSPFVEDAAKNALETIKANTIER